MISLADPRDVFLGWVVSKWLTWRRSIHLLPAASPRAFFLLSPHRGNLRHLGGGPWQDVWGSQQPNKHQGSLGMFGVEKLRDFLFEIGQGFLSMAILFLLNFFKVLFNASSPQKWWFIGGGIVSTSQKGRFFHWEITKYNWNSSTIQRCWTRCNHQSSLSTPRSSVKQRWKENTHTHTK